MTVYKTIVGSYRNSHCLLKVSEVTINITHGMFPISHVRQYCSIAVSKDSWKIKLCNLRVGESDVTINHLAQENGVLQDFFRLMVQTSIFVNNIGILYKRSRVWKGFLLWVISYSTFFYIALTWLKELILCLYLLPNSVIVKQCPSD